MKHLWIVTLALALGCTGADDEGRPPPSGSGDADRTASSCGNDRLDGLEPCDGALFRDGSTCAEYSLGTGALACDACELDFSACAESDLCTANDWYGDARCQDCEDMGGSADTECITLCGDDGTCADELNPITGQWTCQASTGSADPDCGTCGDGTVEDNELCDGTAFAAEAGECTDYGYVDGTLRCDDDCLPDFGACLDHVCGNYVIEAGEECDGLNLGGSSCERLGYFRGDLACSSSCHFDTSGCVAGGSASFDGLAQSMCSFFVRCESSAGRMVASQQSCVTELMAGLDCGPLPPATQTQVNACASRMDTLDCSVALFGNDDVDQGVAFSALGADCLGALIGVDVPGPGQPCQLFCADGYFCQYSLDERICAVCAPFANLNQQCGVVNGRLVACAPEHYCNQDVGTCAQRKADGQPCQVDRECLSGMCRALECVAPLAENETCTPNDVCAATLRCIGGQCADRSLIDGPCAENDDCVLGAACAEGTCVAEINTCTTGIVGDECFDDDDCAMGNYCDWQQTSTCQLITPLGEPCTGFDECGATAHCDEICVPRVGVGETCTGATRCVEGTSCDGGVCVAPAANGTECTLYRDCLSGYCDDVTGLCADPPACTMP